MAAFLGRPESRCSVLIEGAQFLSDDNISAHPKSLFLIVSAIGFYIFEKKMFWSRKIRASL
jgi:hypothetical protein